MIPADKTVAARIVSAVQAQRNCEREGNPNPNPIWALRWQSYLDRIARDCLPSGSGFDSGTRIDFKRTNASRIVLLTSYHHHGEHGYTHWSDHEVWIRPAFDGIDVTVKGRDSRCGTFKVFAHEVFAQALGESSVPFDA